MSSSSIPTDLARVCEAVRPVSPQRELEATQRLDSLTKPLGSLGRLEDMARRLYAVQEQRPLAARPARMVTIAGDHGVVEEGVASSPKEVTVLMVRNFLAGGAAINAICAGAGADLVVVDAGVDAPPFAPHPLLVDGKVARGTANMAKGPAMTLEECAAAMRLGISVADKAAADGVRVLGMGEMGIGNTTASSALFCAYLGFDAAAMTGMGAGVPKAGLAHKARVIEEALAVNKSAVDSGDVFAVLAALGGLEIAALAGLVIGAAAKRMAVMVDGFIATAAFTAAWKLAPAVRDYCFFSHGSAEAGHVRALQELGEAPLLNLGMRLGEGTGAALGFMLLDAAARVFNDMATFEDAGIALS